MNRQTSLILFISNLIVWGLCIGCDEDDDYSVDDQQGIFTVLSDNTTIEVDGEIDTSSLDDFNQLYKEFPDLNLVSIKSCEGSSDDETNFLLMARIYQLNLDTYLQDDGVVASGGVDLFLSGHQRLKGSNTKIGVHAWSSDDSAATDFPEDPLHVEHKPYIDSYRSIGFSPQEAEALYFFIINAAEAEDIHWMTEEEQESFCFIGDQRCSP